MIARRRLVLFLVVLLGLPLFGTVVVYLWISRVADARWAAAEDRILQLVAAHPEGDARRDPESRTEASKLNQIDFVAAIRLAAPLKTRRTEAFTLVQKPKGKGSVDLVLDEAQDFLDRLHEGARRVAASPADFPPRWHGDWDYDTLSYILNCVVLRARRQRERNDPAAAAETLLDSLQLARFWAISGSSGNRRNALSAIPPTLQELRELAASSTLSPEAFHRLERELDPLDAAMQSPLRDLDPILARWGENLRTLDPADEYFQRGKHDSSFLWKHVFPVRLMIAEAFLFTDRQFRVLQESESRGVAEILRVSRGMSEEAERSGNSLVRKNGDPTLHLGFQELERKAQLRLLRMAAHYGATGKILQLADPFDTVPLRHASTDKRMKFWSVGRDVTDHGGKDPQAWRYPMDPDAEDLAIEVPRRP
jgi:hypothetical protein